MKEKEEVHDGCCYRKTCNHDVEKCCYLKSKEKDCMIGGCKE